MAIKYYYKPSTKQTFAELRGCEFDAINKIAKMFGNTCWRITSERYAMKNTYRVSVKHADGDKHDESVARRYAKEKLMKKYNRDLDRAMDNFRADLIEINSKAFKTPTNLIEEACNLIREGLTN